MKSPPDDYLFCGGPLNGERRKTDGRPLLHFAVSNSRNIKACAGGPFASAVFTRVTYELTKRIGGSKEWYQYDYKGT